MNTKTKFKILQALDTYDLCIRLDVNDNYYVSSAMAIAFNGMLSGDCGRGATPDDAINENFRIYCEELPKTHFVRYKDKNYRWNGFMWKEK